MHRILGITVTGQDQPGITASLMEVLQNFPVEILDISQTVIHDMLTLSVIITMPDEDNSLLKDILLHTHERNLSVRFDPLTHEEYEEWVESQNDAGFVVTILGPQILPSHLHRISSILAKNQLNIMDLTRLSGRVSLEKDENPRACVEILVKGTIRDLQKVRKEFLEISSEEQIDIALQGNNIFRRNRRLVAFDMDSTLIQTEVIDELAMRAGVGDQVKAITEAAMRGEIDFDESLRRRVGLLKGLDSSVMEDIAQNLPITPGAPYLVNTLKTFGYKVAIISGGFTFFGNHLKELLGVDYVFANQLEIIDGKLTGNVLGDIVNGPRKAAILRDLCAREKITLDQTIAVGDGANDLPMLEIAGLGIAFHAKPIVRQNAKASMSHLSMDAILYFMGFRDREINPLSNY